MFKTLASAAGLAALTGCATVQPVRTTIYEAPSISSEHRTEHSYQLGVPTEAFVGERMLRVQDFYVTTTSSGNTSTRLVPSEPFSFRAPPFITASFSPTDSVEVTGSTDRDGTTYRLVKLPDPRLSMLRFLITSDGAFEGSGINTTGARLGWNYKPNPSTVRLEPGEATTQVDATKGFTNYELVYGGTTGDSFQLLYREYSQSDLARPAFTQNLVYEKTSKQIRFRNLMIEVSEASNQKIRFSVISDAH